MTKLLLYPVILILTTLATNAMVESSSMHSVFLKNYEMYDYEASSQNWDLDISPEGILYVANSSGLLTFDGTNWTTYPMPDESEVLRVSWVNDTVYTQSLTSVGYWQIDRFGQLNYKPLDSLPTHIRFADPLQDLPAYLPEEIQQQKPSAFLAFDSLNIIGTLTRGIYITNQRDKRILIHFSTAMGLQNNIVHALCIQDSLNVWAAFDKGLVKISFHPALRMLGLQSDIGMLQDVALHKDVLYIKTNINYYKRKLSLGNRFVPVGEEEASRYLSGDTVEGNEDINVEELIGEDTIYPELTHVKKAYPIADNRFWLAGNNEALFVSKAGESIQVECHILFDNYRLDLVRRGHQIVSLNDSLHIASTIQGILLINTNQIPRDKNEKGLPFRFTRMQYRDSKGIHALDPRAGVIRLPHDFHELTVYAGSSIFNSDNQISYKVRGISSDWSNWQNSGKISLLQLPEDDYKLSVRKHVPEGDFPEISVGVYVAPPWYETSWAYLIYAFLLGWFTWTTARNYRKKQKRKEQYLISIERQKTQQLKNEMLEAELENKKNELVKQTSALTRKGMVMNTLLEELEHQKDILGDRYPTKLYTRMRSLMEKVLSDQNDWLAFETYFNSAHQNFIERLRQQYTDITTGDLRICCLLRMNLSTKEIASILNISIRAVELRRYRLRKRMGMDGDTNLVDFLMTF
ncbi:MAG: transcriptional regulator [Tannerellaceae bacterium]|jgi:DNA-binding CsgD family transcriptional regulator|nr:transcriptional regulator [Tannerellaceae bacterium]